MTYKLTHDQHGFVDAIEKDGQVILHLQAGTEINRQNVDEIVELLNRVENQENRESFFCWILEELHHLRCHSHIYSFRLWFMSKDENKREYRLGGKFGNGFKMRRNRDGFYFDQYPEDQTEESQKWIENMNARLKKMSEE